MQSSNETVRTLIAARVWPTLLAVVLLLTLHRGCVAQGPAQTPPMGWDSWNHFADKVTDAEVRAQAEALAAKGLKDAGYVYVNIDDGWAGKRDAAGHITSNEKFPDMKRLGEFIHAKGLKFGIYTSVNPKTCSGLEGSEGHEREDAATYAAWGVDFVKADWCATDYDWINGDDSLAKIQFTKLNSALRATGRPMVYSISGPSPEWRWAADIGANLWRTTIDIKDNWDRVSNIGFSQNGLERFAGPGHWNDPDMLEIGNGGADNDAHDATLAQGPLYRKGMSDEEYRAQMSLWCLLAAPLILGADITHLDPMELAILTNRAVIAIDQDKLGQQGKRIFQEGPLEIWAKDLADGGKAVGFFNRELGTVEVSATAMQLGVEKRAEMTDLWSGTSLGLVGERFTAKIPGHASALYKIK